MCVCECVHVCVCVRLYVCVCMSVACFVETLVMHICVFCQNILSRSLSLTNQIKRSSQEKYSSSSSHLAAVRPCARTHAKTRLGSHVCVCVRAEIHWRLLCGSLHRRGSDPLLEQQWKNTEAHSINIRPPGPLGPPPHTQGTHRMLSLFLSSSLPLSLSLFLSLSFSSSLSPPLPLSPSPFLPLSLSNDDPWCSQAPGT